MSSENQDYLKELKKIEKYLESILKSEGDNESSRGRAVKSRQALVSSRTPRPPTPTPQSRSHPRYYQEGNFYEKAFLVKQTYDYIEYIAIKRGLANREIQLLKKKSVNLKDTLIEFILAAQTAEREDTQSIKEWREKWLSESFADLASPVPQSRGDQDESFPDSDSSEEESIEEMKVPSPCDLEEFIRTRRTQMLSPGMLYRSEQLVILVKRGECRNLSECENLKLKRIGKWGPKVPWKEWYEYDYGKGIPKEILKQKVKFYSIFNRKSVPFPHGTVGMLRLTEEQEKFFRWPWQNGSQWNEWRSCNPFEGRTLHVQIGDEYIYEVDLNKVDAICEGMCVIHGENREISRITKNGIGPLTEFIPEKKVDGVWNTWVLASSEKSKRMTKSKHEKYRRKMKKGLAPKENKTPSSPFYRFLPLTEIKVSVERPGASLGGGFEKIKPYDIYGPIGHVHFKSNENKIKQRNQRNARKRQRKYGGGRSSSVNKKTKRQGNYGGGRPSSVKKKKKERNTFRRKGKKELDLPN